MIKTVRLLWDQGLQMKQILAGLEARGFRNRAGNPFSSPQIYRWTVWSADPDHVNISERTKAALARRKAAGQKLGNPEIRKISPLGVAAVMQNAAQRVADVLPHIDDLLAAGVSGYREMARVLNASEIPSARGGRWHASSVRNVMKAADRSFPAKSDAASRSEQSNPAARQIRIVRPKTQKQRQAIRQQYPEVMAALAKPRLGPVQKQTAQILAYKAEGLSAAGIARVLDVSEPPVARILRLAGFLRAPADPAHQATRCRARANPRPPQPRQKRRADRTATRDPGRSGLHRDQPGERSRSAVQLGQIPPHPR